ncbi:hypothetical protein [Paracoccus onubensis]|uniref:hypothetical protein n=1 Tax=Paracoccus onubensis TaxID=1675788 RepID=UPI001E6447C9|nr:hypothetical protein [Paracoccus onubensis]
MNYEANVITLRRMANGIAAERVALGINPVKEGTHAHNQLMSRIDGWERQLMLMQRQLRSSSNLNALVYETRRFGENSYAARQSYQDKESNLSGLYEATLAIAEEIRELLIALGSGPGGARASIDALGKSLKKIAEMIGESGDDAFSLGGQEREITATVRQLEREFGGNSGTVPASGVIDVFALVLSLFALVKVLKNRKA